MFSYAINKNYPKSNTSFDVVFKFLLLLILLFIIFYLYKSFKKCRILVE